MVRKKFKSLLTKSRKPKEPMIVTGILPCLKSLTDFLVSTQLENGSWANDVLNTSLALQALTAFSKSTREKKLLKNEVKRGTEFLKNAVNSLSDEILQTEELYSNLDKLAIDFGNTICTLWLTQSLKNTAFLKKIYTAFIKVEESVIKFIKTLDNIEVISNILNCHGVSSFPSPPENVLNIAISKILSEDISSKDVFLLILTFQNLRKRYPSLLEEKWNYQVTRRTDNWRNIPLDKGLEKLTIDKYEEMVKGETIDTVSLSYGLIVMNRLNIDTPLKKDAAQRILALCNRINPLKDNLPLSELSLIIYALSESPICKIAFFPLKESNYVATSIKWFEKMKTGKIKLLSPFQYNLLVAFILILISLIAIMSYMAFSNLGIALSIFSILLSITIFLINRLSKK